MDPEGIRQELIHIKSLNVDGVVVDCWWGIVEGWSPQKYVWSGYRELFNIIREFKLNLQVYIFIAHIMLYTHPCPSKWKIIENDYDFYLSICYMVYDALIKPTNNLFSITRVCFAVRISVKTRSPPYKMLKTIRI